MHIKNCVNYGTVTHSGINTINSYIGGIAGLIGGRSVKYIHNCANYGTIVSNAWTYGLYMGGIAGNSWYGTVVIENCVSGGRIVNLTQTSGGICIGNVVGYISYDAETIITHCMWTSDVGYNNIYCYNKSKVTVTNSSLGGMNSATMNGLNEYAFRNNTWDNWFMLHLNGGRINNLTQETLIVTQKHFPDPVKDGYTFLSGV